MNKLFLIVAMLSFSANCFSIDCDLRKDKLLYFEIDIRSNSTNPIIMSGLVDSLDFKVLSIDSGIAFLESFYKQCYYVPDLYKGYNNAIIECMGIENGNKYLETHKNEGQRLMTMITANSVERKIILNNGENVFIRITELTGSFWVKNKDTASLSSTSNEINVADIKELTKIYIPFDICAFKKPSRKYLKEMFK